MDNPGWHAYRRAEREREGDQNAYRGPDGYWQPHEQVMPMDEGFIGGFQPQPQGGPYRHHPPAYNTDYYNQGHVHQMSSEHSTSSNLSNMSAVQRSETLRAARMHPHLQFMVGPLLRYDTVDSHGVWHGAALIVTTDSGSVYEPFPTLKYEWDYDAKSVSNPDAQDATVQNFELAPHPSDPHTVNVTVEPLLENGFTNGNSARMQTRIVQGREIWVFANSAGTFTFWRFTIDIPLGHHEMRINYSINNGQRLDFVVPGRNQNMRWAAHSCNGFSAGVNPDDFRGPGFRSGYDPVWADLLTKHKEKPFHVLVGGGDQLYCDAITREPELQEWMKLTKPADKKAYKLTDEIMLAIDRFYFNHYCSAFRSGAFARANSSIPMLNMCDDHDLIDGFGSYPDDLQRSPMFRQIGSRGYFFFLLFQCFISPRFDGKDDRPGCHFMSSLIVGGDGPYVPFPSHSFLSYLGPQVWMLLLDCRAERKKEQVCSPFEYEKVFKRLSAIPPGVEHLIVQIGIPIAYPRMVFLEKVLDSNLNPLVALGRNGSLGLSGFVNKFNAEAELLDDLNDHWTAKSHKAERNWFVEQLQRFAKAKKIRVTFLSGDVHCAAVGVFKTLAPKGKSNFGTPPPQDFRYMLNVTTSAIVNTPPPGGVIQMVSQLATKTHKTMHHVETDETMLPVFDKETNGTNRKKKHIMGQRNWCCVDWENTGDLRFDIRVEKEKGLGETVGYVAKAPPPRW